MKYFSLIIAASLFLFSGCTSPAEQIIAIQADSTQLPAVTPVPTTAPTQVPAAESVSSPSSIPASAATTQPTPKVTAAPILAPTPTPTVQPTAAPTPKPTAEPTPAPTADPKQNDDDSDFGTGVLALVNSYRSSVGLSSLKYSSAMQKAADTRAKECVSSFSHTRPDGSKAYTALTERGISFTTFGENIFAASGMGSVSAEYVVEQWMASQGHRENILRDGFTHMCIGVASQGEEIYVVQLFGAGIS